MLSLLFSRLCALMLAAVWLCAFAPARTPQARLAAFAQTSAQAVRTLLNVFYAGDGRWRECNHAACAQTTGDWGADSATFVLYLRWATTRDSRVAAVMTQVLAAAPHYVRPCTVSCSAWSDTAAWDAVALMREFDVLGDPSAIADAKAALAYAERSPAFGGGGCPRIPYQQPASSGSRVKTLETDANLIKASLLVYGATGNRRYLVSAARRYAQDRRYFLDPVVPLYTVHLRDDGLKCRQVPRRFFASVNGDMIWNGVRLWRATRRRAYLVQAIATARAVAANLSDQRGIFTDVQGENDVAEPLVEAMYDLARYEHRAFARRWIVENAVASLSARAPDGSFSRLFDGPAQRTTSVWESNGGLALQIAANAVDPNGSARLSAQWNRARPSRRLVSALPATIDFDGSGIALIGTMSPRCAKAHVRVYLDGTETFDRTGLWQNPSMPAGRTVFFAWRFRKPGKHVVELVPRDAAESGPGVVNLRAVILGAPHSNR